MKEVITMWKYPYMIALTIITAAVYMVGLIPFKSIPLIPGFTEIRPANMFPVVFGLLYGPAGAWGSAIGNLLGDLFGTFSPVSIFGFAGNFLLAYIPYKIWGRLGIFSEEDRSPTIDSPKKLIEFGVVAFISSAACSLVIAWGSESLKLVPFAPMSTIIILNNIVMILVFGPLFLPFLYRKMKKRGLIWTDIMAARDISEPRYPHFYSLLVAIGAIGGIATGLFVSHLFTGQSIPAPAAVIEDAAGMQVEISVLPFVIALMFGVSKL